MARKLTDAELVSRIRDGNRRRGERHRKRLTQAGKSSLTVWIPTAIRTALDNLAAARQQTIADTATQLLESALTFRAPPAPPDPFRNADGTRLGEPTPSVDRAERDRLVLELHRQGLSNPKIGERFNTSESSVRRALKRMQESETAI